MYEDYMDNLFEGDLDVNMNQQEDDSSRQWQNSNQGGSQVRVGNIFLYTVRRGDTVFSIARRFNTNPQMIQCMNRLNRQSNIFPGQMLYVPVLFANRPPMQPQPRNSYELYF